MGSLRRAVAVVVLVGLQLAAGGAAARAAEPEQVLHDWYRLVLELVRHTPTYSPPVASRAFAYLGVTAYEATASGDSGLVSLAGQLNALDAVPARVEGAVYDEAVVLNAALASAARNFFFNTGPTGQRALVAMTKRLTANAAAGVAADVFDRSEAHGEAIAGRILAWSADDGGAVVENMGFPLEYTLRDDPSAWVPTSAIAQQKAPLLPQWRYNRTFATPSGQECPVPPHPEYSEDPASDFYKEAMEVYDAVNHLTSEQRAIARFWSDDPMLSPTPPGHWLSIVMQIQEAAGAGIEARVEALALLGITVADAFIGCWDAKYAYDLVRPVTYIRRLIDPGWEALLITPPFPEYPSGHSTQSGAAEVVLERLFGTDFAFTDRTHEADGLIPRSYTGFRHAAEEAGISRLYGGIHYRAAIELGLDQGRCIGAHAVALKTRRTP